MLKTDKWYGIEEWVNQPAHSSKTNPTVLVTSPTLRYICYNGICFGRNIQKHGPDGRGNYVGWIIQVNSKWIKGHTPSHFRHIPDGPPEIQVYDKDDYEKVRHEAERIRKEAGLC